MYWPFVCPRRLDRSLPIIYRAPLLSTFITNHPSPITHPSLTHHPPGFPLARLRPTNVCFPGTFLWHRLWHGQFDALVVDPSPGEETAADTAGGGLVANSLIDGPFDLFPELGQGMQTAFEKFIFMGDDRNIEQVYVAGNRVV